LFRWFADSKAAISRVNRFARNQNRLAKMPQDADLLSIIRSLLHKLRLPITLKWVKGHQHENQLYKRLSYSAKLNLDADLLATRYQNQGRIQSMPGVNHPESQLVSFTINGLRITGQYDESIRFHVKGYYLQQNAQEKNS
jgi:hypothetical protein